jgi:predicted secreted protein
LCVMSKLLLYTSLSVLLASAKADHFNQYGYVRMQAPTV